MSIIPMPEGGYPGRARTTVAMWERPRMPFGFRRVVCHGADIEIPGGVPIPGKGESSYDLDDDATFSIHGAGSINDLIGSLVASSFRRREQYGGRNWTPDAGWPETLARG